MYHTNADYHNKGAGLHRRSRPKAKTGFKGQHIPLKEPLCTQVQTLLSVKRAHNDHTGHLALIEAKLKSRKIGINIID